MIISIEGNWLTAEEEHNSYVKSEINVFKNFYGLRTKVDAHLTKFLTEILARVPRADIEESLKALLAALKIEKELTQHEKEQFRLTLLADAAPDSVPQIKSLKTFEKTHRKAVRKEVHSSWAELEKACQPNLESATEFLRFVIVPRGRKPNNFDYIDDCIRKYISDEKSRESIDPLTLNFLNELNENIGIESFENLKTSIDIFERYAASAGAQLEVFKSNIEAVFNYDKFSEKEGGDWNAYSLCRESGSKTCPYCNQAYAFTIFRDVDIGGFRPTLDHFLPKHKFPHLALSLNNLVPSCYTCNSNLKNVKDFHDIPHLHPLYDKESFTFELAIDGKTSLDVLSDINKIRSDAVLQIRWEDKDNEKVKNTADTFLLERRYDGHLNEALDFTEMVLSLDRERFSLVSDILGGKSIDRLLRFDRGRYRETMMGKMYLDLFNHFHR